MSKEYVSPREATRIWGVSERPRTASRYANRRWEQEGKIETIRTSGGQRRASAAGFTVKSGVSRATILYARVSSQKQKSDLLRQCEYLKSQYPNAELIAKIGGGLNYKRKKMLAILERIMSGDVERIVVAYQDRLCRLGFELFNGLCSKHACEIMVLN